MRPTPQLLIEERWSAPLPLSCSRIQKKSVSVYISYVYTLHTIWLTIHRVYYLCLLLLAYCVLDQEIDNAPEERSRGITINASHIEYETPNRLRSLFALGLLSSCFASAEPTYGCFNNTCEGFFWKCIKPNWTSVLSKSYPVCKALLPRGLPWTRRLCQEHDHRTCVCMWTVEQWMRVTIAGSYPGQWFCHQCARSMPDGWRNSGDLFARWTHGSDSWAHSSVEAGQSHGVRDIQDNPTLTA